MMNEPEPDTELPQAGVGWLRVMVWLMPACLLVCGTFVPEFAGRYLAGWFGGLDSYTLAAILIGGTGCGLLVLILVLAWVDARPHCQQLRIQAGDIEAKVFYRCLVFLVGQFLAAPFLLIMIWGAIVALSR
ncbi:hypothetical protein [Luteolibacter sp. Populi]|uniref:hypothetical protein n=1 Tax=Luteolibacter sp. Populi TaxID=3230487 RepID=UPI00346590B4